MRTHFMITYVGIAMTGMLLLSGCGKNGAVNPIAGQHNSVAEGNLLKSTLARVTLPSSAVDLAAVTDGNNTFGWALFNKLQTDTANLFFSPYSISTAMAMAWQGARGETKTEMTRALHFALDSMRFNIAMNAIDLALARRGQGAAGREGAGFTIRCANGLWGEKTETFLQGFLDPLAQYFGAGMRTCDFVNNYEPTRVEINDTIENQTNGKITELIPPGVLSSHTKLVITNSVYFDAAWADTFSHNNTYKSQFVRSRNDTATAWYMHRTGGYNYAEDMQYQALELPYDGGQVSMVIVLPKDMNVSQSEGMVSEERIKTLIGGLSRQAVHVYIPKFTFTFGTISLKDNLCAMGIEKAFSSQADFSGINGTGGLVIGDVLHKAFVAVDEKGTTAAAATAVVILDGMAPNGQSIVTFAADHPFVFFIRDIPTNQILFMGNLSKPSAE
jgi:serpin B